MKKHLTVDQSLTNATQTLHREVIGLVSKMGASFKGGGSSPAIWWKGNPLVQFGRGPTSKCHLWVLIGLFIRTSQ